MRSTVLALIPARAGSKRLPHKHQRLIGGTPVIEYTIRAASEAQLVTKVVVATDDDGIADIARACGVDILVRPQELCQDTSPIDDTLKFACRELGNSMGSPLHQLLWLQADVPIRLPGMIDRAISTLASDQQATAAVTGYQVNQHPDWMKELSPDGFLAPLFSETRAYRMQDLPDRFLLDGAVVAIRPEYLEKSSAMIGPHQYLGPRPRLLLHKHPMYSLNIDTDVQLELAEFYLRNISQR